MKNIIGTFLVLLLLLPSRPMAARPVAAIRHIGQADGLTNDFVLSMALDGQGNVWVGTEAGLNRIAGRTVSVYYREQLGSSNDKILSLCYNRYADQMLIGTERGLLAYNPRTGSFAPGTRGEPLLEQSLTCLADDHDGGTWLAYANGTVQHLDGKSGEVTTLTTQLPGIRSAMDDGQGHLYIGHGKEGLSIVSVRHPASVRHYRHEAGRPGSLPGNNVRCIVKDREGRIWVGTDHGVALFDALTEDFLAPPIAAFSSPLYYNNVYDLLQLAGGHLWVATDVGGLLTSTGEQVGVSSMNTRCLLQDDYHNIWIGNHSTGIDFIPGRKPLLSVVDYQDASHRPRRIYGVTSDGQGRIWMSTEDELSLWTTRDGTLRCDGQWPITGMKHRAHSFARCLMADGQGHVWLGMEDEGVVRFDLRTHRFETIDTGYDVSDVHSFFEDADGSVWIGTEYGICHYSQGRMGHATLLDSATRRAPVTSFVRTATGRLLLTTQGGGVVLADTRTMQARRLTKADGLPSDNISQALADGQRGVWLATSEGLVRMADADRPDSFMVFGAGEGLADHQVRAVRQDGQGRIWVSTFSGIACFDPAGRRFHNYTQQAGLRIGGFTEGAVGTAADGSLVFGSPGGAFCLQPSETEAHPSVSPVRITLCEAFSPADEGNIVKYCYPDSSGLITLSHQQNTLRIAYAVADYAQVDEVEYSYLMTGLSSKWYYNGTDPDVMFRSLPPGTYTFTLRARLKSQDWGAATTTRLRLRIEPPLWLSWWARCLYALLVAALLWGVFRQYKRRLAMQTSLEMARRESQQKQALNEERLRFFTNIAHELRTPLTLIIGPLEDLLHDVESGTAAPRTSLNTLRLIHQNAERLRSLIGQIMEFRKTETQNRRLTVARGDLGQFVREMVLNYDGLNRNPHVAIRADIAAGLPAVYFDSEVVTTVVTNLLSNAVKYTEQGSITVSVGTTDGQWIDISVADTGYGIAADALPHIFERYYQAKGSHQASGTGIGLALVKSLADLHEGRVGVESTLGKGSRFTFSLGVANDYPDALHKEDTVPGTPPPSHDGHDERRPVLLVVEDNGDIRQYIADSLGYDYTILQAANGEEGCSTALEQMPDIIVSDIMMPRMDGIEMTRRLKNDIRTSHIPIVLLTAKDADHDKEQGYESGADSYLTKPFTARLLASRIRNLLVARRRLAEQLGLGEAVATLPGKDAPTEPELGRLDREFMERLNKVIKENIMLTDIDMAFLTDKMAMSHSTFYRKVKALTGLTAKEYVRKMRLRHCYTLLESGDYNVTEAAMMTGFNQMAHFRETFKKEFGILPSEVRRQR